MARRRAHRPKLVLAAADSGQYGESPSEELQMAIECKRWSTVPYAGGLMDQPAGLMDRLRTLYNVYQAFRSMVDTHMDMKTWSENYPDAWRIVGSVEALRRQMEQS